MVNREHEPFKMEVSGLSKGEKLDEELLNITEYDNVYENEELYLVPPYGKSENEVKEEYGDFRKSDIREYTSREALKLTRLEIEDGKKDPC